MTSFTTLREAGLTNFGVHMGSQFKLDAIFPTKPLNKYTSIHSREYGISVVGNSCKWQAVHGKGKNDFDLTSCVESLNYAGGVEAQ